MLKFHVNRFKHNINHCWKKEEESGINKDIPHSVSLQYLNEKSDFVLAHVNVHEDIVSHFSAQPIL